jgi:hypothetical protein
MTKPQPVVAYFLAGTLADPGPELDLLTVISAPTAAYLPAGGGAIGSPAQGSYSATQAFPAFNAAGFVSLELASTVPAGATLLLETSPDGVTWTALVQLPSGSGLSRNPYLLSGAAYVRAHLTAVTGTAAITLAGLLR